VISALILTKNEEICLPGCLDSLRWCDDVHVFDSFSTDLTQQIAARHGAKFAQRPFDGFASQRNAALATCAFTHEWVLILDADERVPEALVADMQDFVRQATDNLAAARIRRRDFFMGTWLKHAQISPWYIRLVRPQRVCYEREINEVLKVDGEIHELREPFDHHPFLQGISHWVARHNLYSTMEARCVLSARRGEQALSLRKALFSEDFNERRVHQKQLFYRMPLRPMVKWLYMMIVRRAFMDGRAGIAYATLQTFYEYLIELKYRELVASKAHEQPRTA
jgi:glycosyltransferase involved in cell wall biosynthesis